jgi:hypothetical protein
MKRQIKKLKTFNRKLQKLTRDISAETIKLTKVKYIDEGSDQFDNIDILWDDLQALCEEVEKYTLCNNL